MFFFTYLPQAAIMTFTQGPLAAISAALLVLSESSTIFTMLSKTFLIEDALVDTFDGVLMSKGTTELVSSGRQIKAGNDPVAKLGKLIKKPFAKFSPNAIIRYFLYLPLNFIPVVGTIMFLILQGRRAGPAAHTRYFQLKEWNNAQKEKHVEAHKAAYTRYGNSLPSYVHMLTILELASELLLSCWSWYRLYPSCSPSQIPWVRLFGQLIWKRATWIHTGPRLTSVSRSRRLSRVTRWAYHAVAVYRETRYVLRWSMAS